MIEMMKDDFIAPEHIARVKKIDDDTCNVWLVGQSALEPHVVNCSARDFANAVNDELKLPRCEEGDQSVSGDENSDEESS